MLLLVVAGVTACVPEPPRRVCGPFAVQAVAQAADGRIYVAGQSNGNDAFRVGGAGLPREAGPFVAAVEPNGDTRWALALPSDDRTNVGLAVPATAAGALVTGGGAAATRYDDAGNLLWTAGYPKTSLTKATLTVEDQLVVADSTSIRSFGTDGRAAWALALPDSASVSALLADRNGGVWLIGDFSGTSFPPFLPASSTASPYGVFLLHLDRSGARIGGGAWRTSSFLVHLTFDQAVVPTDPARVDTLLVMGTYDEAIAELMLPDPNGRGSMVVAFDSNGSALWSRRLSTQTPMLLVSDGQGALVAITRAAGDASAPGNRIVATRWDATGAETATRSFALSMDKRLLGTLITAAPAGGEDGIILVAQLVDYEACTGDEYFLLRVGGADLQFQSLPFGLARASR